VYRCYPTAGAKAGATVYANFSDPRAQNEHGQPILFAAQFYGSGRTFYIGSPELWRLRAVDEEYFDRFWTKVIREVGQGRLRRGTARGLLLLERNQYALGQTIRVRANLLDPQLRPLDAPSVELNVFDPHGLPLGAPRALTRDHIEALAAAGIKVIINNRPWERTYVNRGTYVHPYEVRRYDRPAERREMHDRREGPERGRERR